MERLSLGKSITVRGYEIRKMPLGAYLRALAAIEDMPAALLAACFPGLTTGGALQELLRLDADMLRRVCAGALSQAPEYLLGLVAELSGVPKERLVNDEALGLDGLIQIVSAVIEVNRLEQVFGDVQALKKTALTMLNAGSKA